MKIAVVVDTFNGANGGTIATMRLVEGLKKRGHQFTIVATKSLEDERFYRVKGFFLPGTKEAQTKMDFMFGIPEKDVLERAFADVDLVQIQFPFYLGYGAAKMARQMDKKVMGAFHVQPQNILAAMGKESKLMEAMMHKLFNFLLFNRVPLIQCPSQFAANMLWKNGCDSALRVVSNGIPKEYVAAGHQRPDFYGDNLVLLNVGRHALEKRQSLLIEGVRRSKYAGRVFLMLCGKGEMTDTLVRLGGELPNKPLIRYVSSEEKLQYLNTADMYVHGSIVELESLSCLEAIGCGLPCLIGDSSYSAAPQFALDDRFIFRRDDADDLAGKIDYWFEHREELRASRAKVLTMAEQYRFERCLDLMEGIYEEFERELMDGEPILEPGIA
jgi:glycosyltransferase involved in cell wall biosynthesis